MKRIIIALLLLCSSVLYAEFTYSKGGINYENCKVATYSIATYYGSAKTLSKILNEFCNGKTVIDIKFQESKTLMSVIIIYKEGK